MPKQFRGSTLRVLALRRQEFGGIATYTNLLATALDLKGVEFVVDDCIAWIPNETRGKIDREVARKVRSAAQGFDLVHAFGLRAAWACADAFGKPFPWVYTAHDMPKSNHKQLIEYLNESRGGGCSSSANRHCLEVAGAKKLQTIIPGLPMNRRVMDRAECRAMLGVTEDTFMLVCAGTFSKEHNLLASIYVNAALPHHVRLIICGQGEQEATLKAEAGDRVQITTERFANQQAIAAADIVIIPSLVAGFSFTAIEAMYQGTAVAMRRTGGLVEIAQDHQSGYYFDTDDELLDLLNHLCYKQEQVREVGRSARQRALVEFDQARTVDETFNLYKAALA